MYRFVFLLLNLIGVMNLTAQELPRPEGMAPNATLTLGDLKDADRLEPTTQALLRSALDLTRRDLTYHYGSADPEKGGMDCSGTIYYLLRENGWKDVPRTASQQYLWVRKAGKFRAVLSYDPKSAELEDLHPGDLLFWSGTYKVSRDPPITHTMIYLGREKKDGRPVMVGASNGRSYRGKQRWGTSVFDFNAGKSNPKAGDGGARFVGYGKLNAMKKGGAEAN